MQNGALRRRVVRALCWGWGAMGLIQMHKQATSNWAQARSNNADSVSQTLTSQASAHLLVEPQLLSRHDGGKLGCTG